MSRFESAMSGGYWRKTLLPRKVAPPPTIGRRGWSTSSG